MKVRSLSLICDYLIYQRLLECLPCCYQDSLRKHYQDML